MFLMNEPESSDTVSRTRPPAPLYLLLWALPQEQTVFSTLAPRVVPMCRLPPDAAVVAAVFLCTLLYKGYKNIYNTI